MPSRVCVVRRLSAEESVTSRGTGSVATTDPWLGPVPLTMGGTPQQAPVPAAHGVPSPVCNGPSTSSTTSVSVRSDERSGTQALTTDADEGDAPVAAPPGGVPPPAEGSLPPHGGRGPLRPQSQHSCSAVNGGAGTTAGAGPMMDPMTTPMHSGPVAGFGFRSQPSSQAPQQGMVFPPAAPGDYAAMGAQWSLHQQQTHMQLSGIREGTMAGEVTTATPLGAAVYHSASSLGMRSVATRVGVASAPDYGNMGHDTTEMGEATNSVGVGDDTTETEVQNCQWQASNPRDVPVGMAPAPPPFFPSPSDGNLMGAPVPTMPLPLAPLPLPLQDPSQALDSSIPAPLPLPPPAQGTTQAQTVMLPPLGGGMANAPIPAPLPLPPLSTTQAIPTLRNPGLSPFGPPATVPMMAPFPHYYSGTHPPLRPNPDPSGLDDSDTISTGSYYSFPPTAAMMQQGYLPPPPPVPWTVLPPTPELEQGYPEGSRSRQAFHPDLTPPTPIMGNNPLGEAVSGTTELVPTAYAVQDATSVSIGTAVPLNNNMTGGGRRQSSGCMAAVPVVASSILSSMTGRGVLLPRTVAADRVVNMLLRAEHDERNGSVTQQDRRDMVVEEEEESESEEGEEEEETSRDEESISDSGSSRRSGSRRPVGGGIRRDEANSRSDSIDVDADNVNRRPSDREMLNRSALSEIDRPSQEDDANSNRDQSAASVATERILNPRSSNNVVVRGMGGLGKTTLAAIVASRRDVLTHFVDGVAWIKLGQIAGSTPNSPTTSGHATNEDRSPSHRRMSYEMYKSHLQSICRQLDVQPPLQFEELVSLPGDDGPILARKVRQLFQSAHQEMTNAFGSKRMLLILDDVWHSGDVDLFCFGNRLDSRCRLLVTTRMMISWGNMTIIDLRSLQEDEAVELLLNEGGRNRLSGGNSAGAAAPPLNETEHDAARRIVRGCSYLPVAVRAAGRLLSTASANGEQLHLSDLAKLISDQGMLRTDTESVLFEILDRSFMNAMHGKIGAMVMKRCFTSFAATFTRDDCLRPWIPVRSIHIFWDGLLTDEERSLFERSGKNVIMEILETMQTMGVLDCTTARKERARSASIFYRIHHDMMHQYGMQLFFLTEIAVAGSSKPKALLKKKIIPVVRRKMMKRASVASSKKKAVLNLHRLFVQNYFTHEMQDRGANTNGLGNAGPPFNLCTYEWDEQSFDDEYIFAHLPQHMIKASLPTMAEEVLSNRSFVRCRLSCMGTIKGTDSVVSDVEMLHQLLDATWTPRLRGGSKSLTERKKNAANCAFEAVSAHLRSHSSTSSRGERIALAYLAMGAALQRLDQWQEAISMLSEALEWSRRASLGADHPTVLRIRDHANAGSLPTLYLIPRESENCVKMEHASELRSMQDADTAAPSKTDNDGDERNKNIYPSAVPMELKSHPSLAIVSLKSQFVKYASFHYTELGIGPKGSAIHVTWDGKHYVREGDGAVMATTSSNYNEGDVLLLAARKTATKSLVRSFFGSDLTVNEDGTLSPRTKPHLALGLGPPNLMLVARDSPTRVILKNASAMRSNTLPHVGHDCVTDHTKVFSSELLSHPGQAIVKLHSADLRFGPVSVNMLGIGPSEDAMGLAYDGRIIAEAETGFVIKVPLSHYKIGTSLAAFRHKSRKHTTWRGGGQDWVINDDGSLSPLHAPNLAMGSQWLGLSSELLTDEQRNEAQIEASRRVPRKSKKVLFNEFMITMQAIASYRRSDLKGAPG